MRALHGSSSEGVKVVTLVTATLFTIPSICKSGKRPALTSEDLPEPLAPVINTKA